MSNTESEVKVLSNDIKPDYLEIQQEDWVKNLLNKLSPEERDVVLDAFKDLKRFGLKKSS